MAVKKISDQVIKGNAYKDINKRQWLIGSFIDESKGLRKDSTVEVMWSIHSAGDKKDGWTKSVEAKTLTILVKGKFVNIFPEIGECLMETEGDYLIYPAEIPHTWKAIEDSVLITVRWPSKLNAIKIVSELGI